MHYHREAFALLGMPEPAASGGRSDLPASVAEWYATPAGVAILRQFSNDDRPVEPEAFERVTDRGRTLAVFLYENQGVCWWAFDLGGGGDPAVFVNVDPPPNRWVRCSDHFSTFVYTRLFDFRRWCHPDLSIQGGAPGLSPETLRALRAEYHEEPSTRGWPGTVQYRFSRDDRRITISAGDHGADWYFSADTPGSLREVFERFRHELSWHTAVEDRS